MNTITYNTKTLKMIEKINGSVTRKTFKSLVLLLEEKQETEDYLLEYPESKVKLIII